MKLRSGAAKTKTQPRLRLTPMAPPARASQGGQVVADASVVVDDPDDAPEEGVVVDAAAVVVVDAAAVAFVATAAVVADAAADVWAKRSWKRQHLKWWYKCN